MVTAVILMTGSVLVILENITKIFHPQPVNDEGHSLAWNHSRQHQCASESRHSQRANQERIHSQPAFSGRYSGLGGCHPNGHCPPIYRLVYSGSALISCHFHLYSVKSHSTFWSTLKIFLDAVPEGVDIQQVKSDLERLDHVASINQLNLWTMDGLEKRHCPCLSGACQAYGGL